METINQSATQPIFVNSHPSSGIKLRVKVFNGVGYDFGINFLIPTAEDHHHWDIIFQAHAKHGLVSLNDALLGKR